MALNFSHRPIFPAHLSEENLVSPMRITNGYLVEGIPESSGDGFSTHWHSNRDLDDCFDYGRDRCDNRCGSQDSVSKDIIDLLPSDPFGMDISTTFTAALTGWLEDMEVDYGAYGGDEAGNGDGNYQLYAGLNFIWNNATKFGGFPGGVGFERASPAASGADNSFQKKEVPGEASCSVDSFAISENGNMAVGDDGDENMQEDIEIFRDRDEGTPHAALNFALYYMGVRDLLAVENVCRSLNLTVRSDPLLWRSIHIGQPLNEKITDDILLQLTSRAQGTLQCLSLVECPRITDDGLKQVLESNPRLTKLSVPGCTRLSIQGIVDSLRAFKSEGVKGVKHLRIGGLYGVTHRHFEELKFLLGTDGPMKQCARKPRFYHRGSLYLSCGDDRPIDIEVCPRCRNLRLVYDCSIEGCLGKEHGSIIGCRACTICIPRCVQCGRCINDSEYEETFCLELLCSGCGHQGSKCQERQVRRIGSIRSSVLHDASCGLSLHG